MWTFRWLETLAQDIRYSLRVLRRSPGFSAVAVLSLALGIGANTAMFSLVHAFLLRQMPVKNPEELVFVRHRQAASGLQSSFSWPITEQLRGGSRSFSGMTAWDDSNVIAIIDGNPEMIAADFVTGDYFTVLGIGALLGRTLTLDDDSPGKPPVVVISYEYWKRRFGLEPRVLGKTITLKDTVCTIVGVTGPGYYGRKTAGLPAALAVPMALQSRLALKDHDTFQIMGRLAPGVAPAQARAEIDTLYQHILQQQGTKTSDRRIELVPAGRGTFDPEGRFAVQLRILQAVTGLVLFIACLNIADLLVARGAARRREFAVRLAIGAGRARLIRQMLTESLLLATAGAALGFLLAQWGVASLLTVIRGSPAGFELRPDPATLGFTLAVCVLASILFGLAPALQETKVDLAPAMKSGEGAKLRFGRALVVCQVALVLLLLIPAGLLGRSLVNLRQIDLGFRPDNLLVLWIYPTLAGYEDSRERQIYGDLLDSLNQTPGVQVATLSRYTILRAGRSRGLVVRGDAGAGADDGSYVLDAVAPRFFETLGIPLLLGRDFSGSDTAESAKVAIVNESLARRYFRGESAIGKTIGIDGAQHGSDRQIVGIVRNMRFGLRNDGAVDAVYIPYAQAASRMLGQMQLKVRMTAQPASVLAAVRQAVARIAPDLPLVAVSTQVQDIAAATGNERSLAILVSGFGALALFLAMTGLYGTLAYSVARRTREIGVRIAVGARPAEVHAMILKESLTLVVAGMALGIPAALAASRLLASFLFGVGAADFPTIGACVVGVFAVTTGAAYVPARRAARIDPTVALRHE